MLKTVNRRWLYLCLAVVLVFNVIVRVRLLDVPLERDEGEYAYAGQLILGAVPPYEGVYNMKMPGIYVVYAAILAVFGQSSSAIHLGLLLVNSANILLIFFLVRKIFDELSGLLAASLLAVLSMGQSIQGVFANAEQFVIFFVLAAIVFLLKAIESGKLIYYFVSGLTFGLGFITKQHGILFAGFGFVYLLITEIRRGSFKFKPVFLKMVLFVTGAFFPFGLTCAILAWAGVFEKFWFWTFTYACKYAGSRSFSDGVEVFKYNFALIAGDTWLVWIFAGFGLAAFLWDKRLRKNAVFVTLFFLFSFLSICPGFYFRPHYFILFLPAVAILAGLAVRSIGVIWGLKKHRYIAGLLTGVTFLVLVSVPIYSQREFLFEMSPETVSRSIYGVNPFPESPRIAEFIKKNSSADDRIAVIGSEPQIYFYSKRRSATSYIYTYPLMEVQEYAFEMQKEMISQIEADNPKFMVFVNIATSWLVREKSDKQLFVWFDNYSKEHYKAVGIVDILPGGQTQYIWGEKNCLNYKRGSQNFLVIFERSEES